MLDWAGVPGHLKGVIVDLYRRCTTDIFGSKVNITIGVKHGDPLSSVLFNLTMDLVLNKISAKLGLTCSVRSWHG